MRQARTFATAVAVWALALSEAWFAASQGVFRTGVDVVRLDVLASEGGRPIAGLGEEDFEVLDNGVSQRISVAGTSETIAVALVLDTSGSVEGQRLEHLVAAGDTVVRLLGAGDAASLVTFSNRPLLHAGSVRDPGSLRSALASARAAGRTALWDSLFAGISLVAGRPERSLVLLLTDGLDNSSWMTRDQVAESLKRTEAVVYAVQTTVPGGDVLAGANRQHKAWRDLNAVVKQSGGDVLQAESTKELPGRFSAVLREFRSRYLVSYEPTGVRRDDGWHRVEVRVKGHRAKVVTRPGYYAAGTQGKQR
jgi:Ca-activated chloride channel homolog